MSDSEEPTLLAHHGRGIMPYDVAVIRLTTIDEDNTDEKHEDDHEDDDRDDDHDDGGK